MSFSHADLSNGEDSDSLLNTQLRSAVNSDNHADAVFALKNGANPDYQFHYLIHIYPAIFYAKSPRMVSLLLQFGTNPDFWIETQDGSKQPLWHYFLDLKQFDLLTALVNHKPCKLLNEDINYALMILMRSDNKESLEKGFNWESPKGICILSFMQASADLQEVVKTVKADPLNWATRQKDGKDNVLVRLMLKYNYTLYENLRNTNKLSDYSSHHNEIPGMVYCKWKLLMLMVSNGGLNSDIINLITLFIVSSQTPIDLFRNYCQENFDLKIKMSNFGILNSTLSSDSPDNKDNFWKRYHHLSPSSFFRQVNEVALRNNKDIFSPSSFLRQVKEGALRNNKDVQTISSLLEKYEISPENDELISTLAVHYRSNHCLFSPDLSPIKEQIKEKLVQGKRFVS